MILTYKYRLKGSRISKKLRKLAWSANQVWNFCTASHKKVQEIYRFGSKINWLSHYDLGALTKGASKELGIHAQTIQAICERFVRGRDLHKKCPRFRSSSGSRRSLGWIPFQPQSRQTTSNSITYLGHTYNFFGAKRRPLPSKAKSGCFVEDSQGRWYVCFYVEVDKLAISSGQIGLDFGLKTLVTTSNGDKYENPTYFRKSAKKLATAQRAGNKKKARAIHCKIKNQRSDYAHKISNKLTSENGLIVVGNVSAASLAKTNFAKSVRDAGWGMLKRFLAYKVSRHQGVFIEVNEAFTTQTCSHCGDCSTAGRPKGIAGLEIREWVCSNCGTHHDRDRNAAQNILNLGRGVAPRADENQRT